MRRWLRDDRGFTLVELLVVLGILALIGGLAVPQLMGVYADAKAKAQTADLALIQSAVDRYFVDIELGKGGTGWPTKDGTAPATGASKDLDYDKLASYLTKAPTTPYKINLSRVVVP